MTTPSGSWVRELQAIVGVEAVHTAHGQCVVYSRDATPLLSHLPDAVVFPTTREQVARLLTFATEQGIPVTPRGAGSSLCAGAVPLAGGIVLALTRMNQIIEINDDERLARVQPGVSTAALADAVGQKGMLYAPDPGSRIVSTIGGNVATCAGGLRGLKYGTTRNHVLGLEAVLATGEIIRTGGRLWKDVAGYDLTRLLTGSEGTLAVITEVTLALLPAPATTSAGVAYFATLADAGRAVSAIIATGVQPATLEFLDNVCIKAVEDFAHLGLCTDAGALLIYGDDGEAEAVHRNLLLMQAVCEEIGAISTTSAGTVTQSEALLAARRCSLPALSRSGSLTILEDASVPRPKIADMVNRIGQIADRWAVTIGTFGHAGDGNLHPTAVIDVNDGDAITRAQHAFDDIFRTALGLGGTITGEHGVGATKRAQLPSQLGVDQIALLQRIKRAFDPAGILNPGKVL